MIPEALFAGALVGGGTYVLARTVIRPKPGVALLVARIDSGRRSMATHTSTGLELQGSTGAVDGLVRRLGDSLEVLFIERGWRLGRTQRDLGLLGRSLGQFLATKVLMGVLFFALAPTLWIGLSIAGVGLPGGAPLLFALLFGAFGFFIPDLAMRAEAEKRRKDFRHVVGTFLDLVAMNLAGGRGLPEALLAASTVSNHWALVRIRQSLANARLLGSTPWAALGDLGDEIGVEELRDLSGALALAADDGAKIRASLSARAATLRRKELTDQEGDAGERSQSMLVAQLLICAAFLLFLVYPALARITTST